MTVPCEIPSPFSLPFPRFAVLAVARETISQLLDKQFGPGRARLVQMVTVRADESDEYHESQLREKNEDASAHSNYGVFLKEKKGNLQSAERKYRKAIDRDGNHVDALGNLANLLGEKGDRDQASSLYRRVLQAGPGNETVTWNYARFLSNEFDDRQAARDVLDHGIAAQPESGRLPLLRAKLSIINGNALETLEDFRRAREQGADLARVEVGYAFALEMSGASDGECIAAYHVAITLTPENGALRLTWLNSCSSKSMVRRRTNSCGRR